MRLETNAVLMTAACCLLSGCDWDDWGGYGDSRAYQKDFHYSHDLKPGGKVSVENYNGSIEISSWDQARVDISGQQYGATPELRDAIRIDVTATGDTVRIRTIRPIDRKGNNGARYLIKVPRKTGLEGITSSNGHVRVDDIEGLALLRTTNGSIQANRLRGSLEATTSNGGVEIRDVEGAALVRTNNGRVRVDNLRGALDAETTNGGIQARIAKHEAGRPLRFETTNGGIDVTLDEAPANDVRATTSNGGITVRMPTAASARVRARTTNSSIHTEFDIRPDGAISKHRLEGSIGSGGPILNLTTSNGTIRIVKL